MAKTRKERKALLPLDVIRKKRALSTDVGCTFFYIPSYIDGRLDLCHVFYHLWDFTGEKR